MAWWTHSTTLQRPRVWCRGGFEQIPISLTCFSFKSHAFGQSVPVHRRNRVRSQTMCVIENDGIKHIAVGCTVHSIKIIKLALSILSIRTQPIQLGFDLKGGCEAWRMMEVKCCLKWTSKMLLTLSTGAILWQRYKTSYLQRSFIFGNATATNRN